MSDYDFDFPAPNELAGRKRGGIRDKIAKIPKGASVFIAMPHKSNVVGSTASELRRTGMRLVCRREENDGVEGYRVWHLKDEEN